MAEYLHHELGRDRSQFPKKGDIYCSTEEVLDVGERQVIVFQQSNASDDSPIGVVVPGYVNRLRFKNNDHGIAVSEVQPIGDRAERVKVIEAVWARGLEGAVMFWPEHATG